MKQLAWESGCGRVIGGTHYEFLLFASLACTESPLTGDDSGILGEMHPAFVICCHGEFMNERCLWESKSPCGRINRTLGSDGMF